MNVDSVSKIVSKTRRLSFSSAFLARDVLFDDQAFFQGIERRVFPPTAASAYIYI